MPESNTGLQVLGEVDLDNSPDETSSGPTVLGEVDLPSRSRSDSEIDRTTRLTSSPELPAARGRLDIGAPHQGTATQEVERQAGPPLVLNPTRKAEPLSPPPATERQITPVGRPALGQPRQITPTFPLDTETTPQSLPPIAEPLHGGVAQAEPSEAEKEIYRTPYRGVQQMEKGFSTLFPQQPTTRTPGGKIPADFYTHPERYPDKYPSGKELVTGATDVLGGAGKALTPAMIAGAAAAPVAAVATGLGAKGVEYGVGKLADMAHASPETKAFFQELAQWGGGLLGAKAGAVLEAMPPAARESALTDLLWKRGYVEDNNGQPIHIETRPQAQSVAREMIRQNPKGAIGSLVETMQAKRAAGGVNARESMGVAPPAPPQPLLPGSVDEAAATMASANERAARAARQSAGIPEPAPPPPPAPDLGPGITQANVDGLVGLIKTSTEAERPQMVLHAHELLAKWALSRGTGVGPDGKVFTVKDPEQAGKLAAGWINDEVANQDKIAVEQQKAAEKKGPSIAEGITASRAAARKGAIQPDSVIAPARGNELSETLSPDELDSGAWSIFGKQNYDDLNQEQRDAVVQAMSKTTVGKSLAHPEGRPQVLGEVDLPSAHRSVDQRAGAENLATVPAAGPTVLGEVDLPASAEAPKLTVLGEEHLIKKGQQVVLPGGEKGTVHYISDDIARVEVPKPEGGTRRVSIPPGKLKAVETTAPQAASKTGIILARHGATELDQPGSNETVAGWSAEPLDDRGIAAANKMAESLKDSGITHIISSDLLRAKQTAEIVGNKLGLPVKTDERLRPQHVPETEGLKIDEAKKIWDHYEQHSDEKPKGGESWNQFTTRQAEALKEIDTLAKSGKPLVMTHSRNIESALGKKPEPGGFVETKTGERNPNVSAKAGVVAAGTESSQPVAAKFKYGSTQANVPAESEAHSALETARSRISDSDLAGKGKDVGGNHLTVRYGIQGDDTAGIKKYLASLEPFEASLGKTEKFPPSEHSEGAAVIVAPIEAPELHKINSELEKHGDFTEPSFKEYRPHSSLAYVKPERADRYVGMAATAGKKFTVNSIAITDRNGKREEIQLQGQKGSEKIVTPAPKPESTMEASKEHEQPKPVTEARSEVPNPPRESGAQLAPVEPEAGKPTPAERHPEPVSGRRSGESAPSASTGGSEERPSESSGGTSERGVVPASPEPARRGTGEPKQPRVRAKNTDWFIHPEDFDIAAGNTTRLQWNLKALDTLKKILSGETKATDEDREALARYVGWGALQWVFDPYGAPWKEQEKWRAANAKLLEHMGDEQFRAARKSTMNAHFTSPQVVRAIWDAVKAMGFKGGSVLETSMGTGNFFGMMPKEIKGKVNAIGNELDPTTYNIAKILYPSATLFNKDFSKLILPDNSVDLVVGNVPFGEEIYDPHYPKLKARIHDYFIVKSLDKVRPGGVVAVISSTGTLDKPNSRIRQIMADKADLMYALRFPSSTFEKTAGTHVTTDFLVFQKREPGALPGGEAFTKVVPVEAPHEQDKISAKDFINEYFDKHPENLLGKLMISRRMYGSNDLVLAPNESTSFADQLKEAISRVPKKLFDTFKSSPAFPAGDASSQSSKRNVKQMEKSKANLEAKIARLSSLKSDKTINFDDTGIDTLFVDEAHEYKNLLFYTKMNRVAGLAQGEAMRATRLKMKTDYLLDKNGNRGVIFATGTPVQNTMAEMYNMTRYVAPDVLHKAGIRYFDDWAANFGKIITAMQLSPDAETYKTRSKFAEFVNLPELQMMFTRFADVKTVDDLPELKDLLPKLEGGKPTFVEVDNPDIEPLVKQLVRRAAALRGDPVPVLDEAGKPVIEDYKDPKTGEMKRRAKTEILPKPKPEEDNMLVVVNDGRLGATDLRLLNPSASGKYGKINKAAEIIHKEWKDSAAKRGTQLVFIDRYRHVDHATGEEKISLYRELTKKLVDAGIPKDQIAVIHDAKGDDDKLRLFEKVNQGKVRVLLGSTQKMGAGMNAQTRMIALHHIDLPWKPGELEQREGRIIRQGNENPEVRIYYHLTKRSFDAYMADTLQTKAKFIWQAISGKDVGRSITDAASDAVLSYEEMKAISSGNPDIKRKMEIEAKIRKLETLERQHAAMVLQRKGLIEEEKVRIARFHAASGASQQTLDNYKRATGTEGKEFSLDMLGKKFSDREAAGEWLKTQDVPTMNLHITVDGVPVTLRTFDDWNKPVMEYMVPYPTLWRGGSGSGPESIAGTQNSWHTAPERTLASAVRSIESVLRNLPGQIDNLRAATEFRNSKVARLQELAKEDRGSDNKELHEAQKELAEVNQRLGIDDLAAAHEQEVTSTVEANDEEDKPQTIPHRLWNEETGTFIPAKVGQAALKAAKPIID
jgi:broad specificity phosphatase PhoE